MTVDPKPLTLGGLPVIAPQQVDRVIHMLLWGPSGAGKTVLASTFPGRKLWLQFDPEGTASLGTQRDDVLIVDYSSRPPSYVEEFKTADPVGLGNFIKQNGINTIVCDSITAFQDAALLHGVSHARGTKQHAGATVEDPGYGGYGRRKTWTMMLIMNILAIAQAHRCHTCFISHEDSPTTDDKGAILHISMLLGSDLPDKTGLQVGEIWNLVDTGNGRRILVRPARFKKPIKTRMFDASKSPEFMWKYEQSKPDPAHTVAGWYEAWKANGFNKIPLPT